jgi:hypothetical protein
MSRRVCATPTVRISSTVKPSTRDRLEAIAAERKLSMSEIIDLAIVQFDPGRSGEAKSEK